MKIAGTNSLTLFKFQSNIDDEIKRVARENLFESLGLEKPTKKEIQKFDIPSVPKVGDFMFFPFRHLSATIVGGGSYKATDFSNAAVLKRSVSLLSRKPAYLNHNQAAGKDIGTIGDAEWSNAYTHPTFGKIPGGIEAPFIIDSILYPDLCRKLSSPVSSIDAASVTVFFEWEASHEFESNYDFYYHLGEMKDDDMVRRIVTNIIDYAESSLCFLGADPYARMLDEKGKLVSIDRAAAFTKSKFSDLPELQKWDPQRSYYLFDCLDSEKFLHLSKTSQSFNKSEPEKNIIMDEILILLAAQFGISIEQLKAGSFKKADLDKFTIKPAVEFAKLKSEEDYNKIVLEKKTAEDKVVSLTADLDKVKTEKTALEADKTKNTPFIKVGQDMLTASRAEAKRLYGIFSKGKPEKALEDELETETDFAKLDAKISAYGGAALSSYTAKCEKCGNTELTFRSSKQTEGGGTTEKESNSFEDTIYALPQ